MERLSGAVGRDSLSRIVTGDWSIRIVNVLCVAAFAYTLAELTWRIVPQPPTMNGKEPASTTNPAPTSRSITSQTTDSVQKWSLFGNRQKTAGRIEIKQSVIPETRLNLKLTGILASEKKADSRAIISVNSGKEQFYAINAKLSGNAKLADILGDHVLIDRNGRYETLRLLKKRTPVASIPNSRARPASQPRQPGKMTLRDYREAALKNPAALNDLGQVRPVNRAGKMIGIRLIPKSDRSLLRRHGVQRNDIITAVNGIEMDSPLKGVEIMNNIQSSEQIELTLLRSGKKLNVTLSLDK